MKCDDEAERQVVDFETERRRRYPKVMARRRKRDNEERRATLWRLRDHFGWPDGPDRPGGGGGLAA